jgi:2'-5' RNA ligase/endonuclease/exonuclease/phosphatase family metal-dependent hydrolase
MELPEPPTGRQWAASTETALCLIPPREVWEPLDRFRSLYDKAYGKWPPHINLVYPFVQPERIDEAVRLLGGLDLRFLEEDTLPVALEQADCFVHKHSSSIHIRPASQGKGHHLKAVANAIRGALGWDSDDGFLPHLTLGQSQHEAGSAPHLSLLSKARLLTPLAWNAHQISILIRAWNDTTEPGDASAQRDMRLWGSVAVFSAMPTQLPALESFYAEEREAASPNGSKQVLGVTYHFTGTSWSPMSETQGSGLDTDERMDRLVIASYNVLADFDCPPNHSRYGALVSNLLSVRASADILVLEEVTDDFLAALLADEQICSKYPYATHGPPHLKNIGHLPNHLNIVVLSHLCFTWGYLPSHRKHKGFVLAEFSSLMDCGDVTDKKPLVVAGCHLTHGLVDSAVAAKKSEVRKLLSYLWTEFPDSPCVIAGDFNLPTSTYTIDTAREKQSISAKSRGFLNSVDSILSDAHLQDAWLLSRIESGESSSIGQRQRSISELYEGEEGATFDPGSNKLAEKLTRGGHSNRPQRYDRILVNDRLQLRPRRFNLFGAEVSDVDGMPPSDHWGIRCLLERPTASTSATSSGSQPILRPIQPRRAVNSLGGMRELMAYLSRCPEFPKDEATDTRVQAIHILEKVLQCRPWRETGAEQTKGPILILVPVGSFGLGVWDNSSDVDCLCIGEISSDVFFKLAISRLRKATTEGVTILRRVRMKSGTMLQLNIRGVIFDLQYCCAASVAKG